MPLSKGTMTPQERKNFEFNLTKEFLSNKDDTRRDLNLRLNGVAARAGSSGYQFAGYTQLERFYRGDQWDHNEPVGASQRTDNYCAVIVDNISSLVFDDIPEINCPTDDPTDDLLELKAEMKERLLRRVWEDNDFEVEFDSWSKQGSLYGDGYLIGPWVEKVDELGNAVDSEGKGTWKIKFSHVENPGSIRQIFSDDGYKKLLGFIQSNRISVAKANMIYGDVARAKGIKIEASQQSDVETRIDPATTIPMVNVDNYWTGKTMAVFMNDKLLDYYLHNWGFVPLEHVKNIYVPNHPYGKSDIEDVLDPQLFHNRTNNDLANLLKWISSVNLWGKNLEGMQALVAGLSRIYSLPEDGEIHAFEKTGDPYVTNTFVAQRRSTIIEISGVSEALLSSSQVSNASGRALALAFQGTIRKLNPRIKRFRSSIQNLNKNIMRLMELYFPETKVVIEGDYRNNVYLPATLLRNIVDTINKFQSGLISQDTAMREAGVNQPKLEQKLMKKGLTDPILGPQIARQPSLLPRLSEGQNQPGDQPNPAPGNAPAASQAGAVTANNQQSSGAAPTPTE
ncbi:MAG: phage portal protein [Parcubacteria group bacterium]|nr:phage portal protein [Parcubacteria group bacterium]